MAESAQERSAYGSGWPMETDRGKGERRTKLRMEAKRKGLRRLTLKRLLLMELLLLLLLFFCCCLARHGEEKPKREQGGQRGRATLETAVNAEEDGCECDRTR